MISNWQQDLRTSLKNNKALKSFFHLDIDHTHYPSLIPQSFAHKIKDSKALQTQFLPSTNENHGEGLVDPIADHKHVKMKRLIHRYPNRVLFLPTDVCPILCRYCFRKNELGKNDELFKPGDQSEISHYLKAHPEVEEVIFTGGDPLILSNQRLDEYMGFFASIPTIKMIRFHSRTPVILPSRIDEGFIKLIKKYQTRFSIMTLVIHTNHVDEWSDDFTHACHLLRQTSLQLLSQSVLLKGVNDHPSTLKDLFYGLCKLDVKPYYLHHPDQVKGAMHFYLSHEEGLKIYQELKACVSGWALPHYVCEQEEGMGKVLTSQLHAQNKERQHLN